MQTSDFTTCAKLAPLILRQQNTEHGILHFYLVRIQYSIYTVSYKALTQYSIQNSIFPTIGYPMFSLSIVCMFPHCIHIVLYIQRILNFHIVQYIYSIIYFHIVQFIYTVFIIPQIYRALRQLSTERWLHFCKYGS